MKKKYKTSWMLTNLLSASQAEVVQLQMLWAGFSTVIGGSTFIMSDAAHTLAFSVAALLIDKVAIGCLHFEEIKTIGNADKSQPDPGAEK